MQYLIFLIVLLSGCASVNTIPTDYKGVDAGKVVIGIGAATGTRYSSYSFLFRKRGQTNHSSEDDSRLTFFQDNVFLTQKLDYENDAEGGVVLVASMPPGEYEIFNFDVYLNGYTPGLGNIQKDFSSKSSFSIPFNVKAREVTYLGNYQANLFTGKNYFGMDIPAGAQFVVEDRATTEFPIAQKKGLIAEPFINSTPVVTKIGNPFFIKEKPQQLQPKISPKTPEPSLFQ